MDTANPIRIENAGSRSIREIIIVSIMTPFFIALLALVTSTFRTSAAQQAEIVALRHQIAVLQQGAPRRLRLRQSGRLLWIWLSGCVAKTILAWKPNQPAISSVDYSAFNPSIWRMNSWQRPHLAFLDHV